MSKVNHRLGAKLLTWVAVLVLANTLGAYGYTLAAGARYTWKHTFTRIDRAVAETLASVP